MGEISRRIFMKIISIAVQKLLSRPKVIKAFVSAERRMSNLSAKMYKFDKNIKSKKLIKLGGEVLEYNEIKPPKFNNLKEIRKFNKEILDIKQFDVDDYDMAEYLTEGFVSYYKRLNATDIGLIKKVKTISNPNQKSLMAYNFKTDTLYIYKETLKELKSEAAKRGQTISQFMEELGRHKRFSGTTGKYNYLFHELGHAKHARNCPVFEKLRSLPELENSGIKDTSLTKEFLEDAELQQIAGKVSEYAKKSPAEFVAETSALLKNSVELPADVKSLYNAYYNMGKDTRSVRELINKHSAITDFFNSHGCTEISFFESYKQNTLTGSNLDLKT